MININIKIRDSFLFIICNYYKVTKRCNKCDIISLSMIFEYSNKIIKITNDLCYKMIYNKKLYNIKTNKKTLNSIILYYSFFNHIKRNITWDLKLIKTFKH